MSDAETYQSAVVAARVAAELLAQHDIPELLNAIERAHALGPVLDPTLYRNKAKAMEEDRELLAAALPLMKLGKRIAEVSRG